MLSLALWPSPNTMSAPRGCLALATSRDSNTRPRAQYSRANDATDSHCGASTPLALVLCDFQSFRSLSADRLRHNKAILQFGFSLILSLEFPTREPNPYSLLAFGLDCLSRCCEMKLERADLRHFVSLNFSQLQWRFRGGDDNYGRCVCVCVCVCVCLAM